MNLEVPRNLLELLPREGNALDNGMFLGLDGQYGLVEDYSLVLLSEHAHQTLHEILGSQAR